MLYFAKSNVDQKDGLVRKWIGHTAAVWAINLDESCEWAATGSWDGSVRKWDIATGSHKLTMSGHSGQVYAAEISNDGTFILSVGEDGTARKWSAEDGTELQCATAENDPTSGASSRVANPAVYCASIAPSQNSAIIGCSDYSIKQISLTGGGINASYAHGQSGVQCCSYIDSSKAVTGSGQGAVAIWDLGSGTKEASLAGHSSMVRCCAVLHSTARVLTGSMDQTVKCWDLFSGECVSTISVRRKQATDVTVNSICQIRDATTIALGCSDNLVRLYDLRKLGKGPLEVKGQAAREQDITGICDLAVSADGRCLLTGHSDNKIGEYALQLPSGKAQQSECSVA
jgi:WD40 repeat protein